MSNYNGRDDIARLHFMARYALAIPYGFEGTDEEYRKTLEPGQGVSLDGYASSVDLEGPLSGWVIDLATSGDYAGGHQETANRRDLVDIFERYDDEEEEGHGFLWFHLSFGFNASGLFILDNQDIPYEVVSVLMGLSNYPLISETTLSEVSLEAELEAWDSFGAYDFKKDLEKAAWYWLDLDNVTDDALSGLFVEGLDAGLCDSHGEGTSWCFGWDKFIKDLGPRDIMRLEGVKVDPAISKVLGRIEEVLEDAVGLGVPPTIATDRRALIRELAELLDGPRGLA